VRRPLIGLLLVALVAVLWFKWQRAEARAARPVDARAAAPFEWANVSSRDLNIAAVFLTARQAGVARAMDSLQALSIADTTFRNDGHMIAHALGRFAIANNGHDPSVLSQCRPTFQAGCYHGVLEGYMASVSKVDPRATSSLCAALERPGSSRFHALECAHGLGHGFVEALGYNLNAALSACDAFSAAQLRSECHDGVFMENTVRGLGMSTMNVGDSASGAQMHMMTHAAPNMATFRASDLRFPCDSVGASYQPSCWAYQPLVIARLTRYDVQKTLNACREAPAASIASCYQGFGKQSMGWFSWSFPRVIATCKDAASHQADCLAGGVEALIDLTLTADRAATFCAAVPAALQPSCFTDIGTRMANIRSTPADAERDCAAAGKTVFVDACLQGAKNRS
jgi:hypothetical protein